MTNREFFVAVANGEMTEEIRQHASEQIEKMIAADEKRRNKPSPAGCPASSRDPEACGSDSHRWGAPHTGCP